MPIKKDVKEFHHYESCDRVFLINGKSPIGRQASYIYKKCSICQRIIGTQFNGFKRHMKTHDAISKAEASK